MLTARVARQDERIVQLECRLNRSSGNSSIPPSADLSATPKRGKDPSGRNRAPSPVIKAGAGRFAGWAVDRVIEHWPERCGCGHLFAVDEHVAVGEPVRWQVEELPAISVAVTEHRCYRVVLSGLRRTPASRAAERGRPERVRSSPSGGRRDAFGAQQDLPARRR